MKQLFAKTKKKLTSDETQEVLTPFAFTIDNNLIGTALASPWKRGIALAVDLLLVAILSSAGGEFLAIALAIMVFRLGSKKKAEQQGKVKGRKRRAIMRFIGALLVLFVLLDNFSPAVNKLMSDGPSVSNSDGVDKDGIITGEEVDVATSLKLAGFAIKTLQKAEKAQCTTLECWKVVFEEVPKQALSLKLAANKADELFSSISKDVELSLEDSMALKRHLSAKYKQLLADQKALEPKVAEVSEKADNDENQANDKADYYTAEHEYAADDIKGKEKEDSRPIYSMVEWFKALINDLGLGFGWAAFYFTVFTSRWGGKTPGKKLMGIRVLQLDGTSLSLWDSFGRYGGYGAGLATGLLGFLQIYWDPNRQAIQDKISATIVIDENKVVDSAIVQASILQSKDK